MDKIVNSTRMSEKIQTALENRPDPFCTITSTIILIYDVF